MAFVASSLLPKITVPTISSEFAGFLTVTLSVLDESSTVSGEKYHLCPLKTFLEDSISKSGGFTIFTITDGNKDIAIVFDGFVPELFQENMGVILDGVLENNTFFADDMLVKHDNEYVSSDGETYNVENYSE